MKSKAGTSKKITKGTKKKAAVTPAHRKAKRAVGQKKSRPRAPAGKKSGLKSLHSSRYQSVHGAYYFVGAAALAFSMMLVIYQNSGPRPVQKLESAPNQVTPRAEMNLSPEVNKPGSQSTHLLDAEFKKSALMGVQERIDHWSLLIETNPKMLQELRQSVRSQQVNDSAPIVPERLDCTTFVETVVALSRSESPKDFVQRLIEVRYREGQPSFLNRNHFVEADWVPNNEKSKVLRDITSEIASNAGFQAQSEERVLHRDRWLRAQLQRGKGGRQLASIPDETLDVKISYLPLEKVGEMMNQIPSGSIVNFVREKSPNHAVLVSHQGILIRDPSGQVYLRHASIGGQVRTELLGQYLAGLKRYNQKSNRWGWLGLNLNQISSSSPSRILRSDAM